MATKNTTIPRRAVLLGAGAAVALPAVAAVAHPDAPLIAAHDAYFVAVAEEARLAICGADDVFEAARCDVYATVERAAEIPAATMTGLRAKSAIVQDVLPGATDFDLDMNSGYIRLVMSLAADTLRLVTP